MPGTGEPHDPNTGRHRLGPHVVGQRVVVRHLLPDGRATDVLGVCTAWTADSLTVDTDDGPVTVPLADVVTGKPVPPRASVRARVSARDAELHGLVVFPGLDLVEVGDWLVRSDPEPAERLFKRANSCLAMGDPGMPFDDAEAQIRQFYGLRGRPPLVQVERDSDTEAAFAGAGWTPLGEGDTDFLVAPLGSVARLLPSPPEDVRVSEDGPRVLAELLVDGRVGARGRAAYDDDWLGLHALATAPPLRRRGLARQVLAELLDWGAVRGARTLWLHVETDNAPARAFYDALGFRAHHGCRYLTPGS
ncbi:GNAT family N-acetyltransferase [Nocardioides rotundus]|uniref:GNAT family N-acetyltransferase n=1 Tax=Nocardioides rotundus TaxID=1774216 RepID=UPI001CBF64DE|nr:GNAT family N-acetyltransferase [Nocardioides rotundus]UAL30726.1 GNAT family N-acetyltransferase [Nocardioides rotundus]